MVLVQGGCLGGNPEQWMCQTQSQEQVPGTCPQALGPSTQPKVTSPEAQEMKSSPNTDQLEKASSSVVPGVQRHRVLQFT